LNGLNAETSGLGGEIGLRFFLDDDYFRQEISRLWDHPAGIETEDIFTPRRS